MPGPIKLWTPRGGRQYGVIGGTISVLAGLRVRAIELQSCEGFDVDSFKPALRMFIAAKGLPPEIFSENGGKGLASEAWIPDLLGNDDDEQLRELDPQLVTKWVAIPIGGELGRCWPGKSSGPYTAL